jgi:hypothetical protein
VSPDISGYLAINGVAASPSAQWIGDWSVSVSASPASTQTDILEYPDLQPVLPASQLVRGRQGQLTLSLQRLTGGSPTAEELAQPHSITAALGDPTGSSPPTTLQLQAGREPGTYAATVTVPANNPASSLNLVVTLSSLGPDRMTLTTIQRAFTIPVALPASFPTLDPLDLNFGGISGPGNATTTLRVIGGSDSGCADLSHYASLSAPQGIEAVRVQSPAGCVAVGPHQVRFVNLTLLHDGQGSGLLKGRLDVTMESNGQSLALRVPVSAAFTVPVRAVERDLLLAGLVLLGIILPLLVMFGLSLAGSLFRPKGLLQYVELDVSVTNSGVEPIDNRQLDAQALAKYFRPVEVQEDRQIRLTTGATATSSITANPFGAPVVLVQHPTRDVVASAGTERRGDRWVGSIPTHLWAAWVFEVTARERTKGGEPRLVGHLTLLCQSNGGEPDPWPKAVAHARARLPESCLPLLKEEERFPALEYAGARRDESQAGGNEGSSEEPDPRMSLDLFPNDE